VTASDIRYWPKSDVIIAPMNVRFEGKSGNLRGSVFTPSKIEKGQPCWLVTFRGVR